MSIFNEKNKSKSTTWYCLLHFLWRKINDRMVFLYEGNKIFFIAKLPYSRERIEIQTLLFMKPMKLFHSRIFLGFFVLILILSLPIIVLLSQERQNTHQHAASSQADITVDFGFRLNHAFPISPTFTGVGGSGAKNVISQAGQYVAQANLRLSRTGDYFASIFPTPQSATMQSLQNWTLFDQDMDALQRNNMRPVIILNYTPSLLQPTNNPCSTLGADLSHVNPTDDQVWGQLAAQDVAHIDAQFPQLHSLYEFWNEPDGKTYGASARYRITDWKFS